MIALANRRHIGNGRYPPKPWGGGKYVGTKTPLPAPVFEWLAVAVIEKKCPRKDVAAQLNMPEGTLKHHLARWKKGMRDSRNEGRPRRVTEKAMEEVREILAKRVDDDLSSNALAVKELALKALRQTDIDRNQAPSEYYDKRKVAKVVKELDLGCRSANLKNKARREAEHDPLNAVSTMVLWHHIHANAGSPDLVINVDATPITIGSFSEVPEKVYYPKNMDLKKPVSAPSATEKVKPMSLNWYNIMTASGGLGPLVFRFPWEDGGDQNLPLVIPIEGMTASLDATQNGYVVFTETLQKDRLFFEWLQVDLMGQWIKQMQVTRADKKQAFVLMDGEDTQITEASGNPRVYNFCKENSISIEKPPASTTRLTQSCDAGRVHCDVRSGFNYKWRNYQSWVGLEKLLQEDCFTPSGKYWTTKRCNQAIKMCVCLTQAIADCVTRPKILASWRAIGLYPTPCIRTVAQNFNLDLDAREYTMLAEDLRNAKNKYTREGSLNDRYLVSNFRYLQQEHIKQLIPSRNQDKCELTLHSQRSVTLTHTALNDAGEQRRKLLMAEQKKKQSAARSKLIQKLRKQQGGRPKRKTSAVLPAAAVATHEIEAVGDAQDRAVATYLENARRRKRR